MNLELQDKQARLNLNEIFYSKSSVTRLMEMFKDVCDISYEKKENYHCVRFSNLPEEDLKDVALEFANDCFILERKNE